jgi:hypothetical protein
MPCCSQPRRNASLLNSAALSRNSDLGLPLIGHSHIHAELLKPRTFVTDGVGHAQSHRNRRWRFQRENQAHNGPTENINGNGQIWAANRSTLAFVHDDHVYDRVIDLYLFQNRTNYRHVTASGLQRPHSFTAFPASSDLYRVEHRDAPGHSVSRRSLAAMDADPDRIVAGGQLTMSDAAWEQARIRASVIGSLAERGITGIVAADKAALELGVSRRQIYTLLGRYRQGAGLVTDLAVHRSTGGKGGNRLPEPVEEIIRDLIRRRFLTRQKLSVAALHREIVRACASQGMKQDY